MSKTNPRQKGHASRYTPGGRLVLLQSLRSVLGFTFGTSWASFNHWPSPRDIRSLVHVLEEMYPILFGQQRSPQFVQYSMSHYHTTQSILW